MQEALLPDIYSCSFWTAGRRVSFASNLPEAWPVGSSVRDSWSFCLQIMVFFVTANQTALAAEVFEAAGQPILEMHSRKSQAARTRTANKFRTARQGIMFTSDVSARGVDYPDVTLVVQVSMLLSGGQFVA